MDIKHERIRGAINDILCMVNKAYVRIFIIVVTIYIIVLIKGNGY
jgi:hypothetical protein